MKLLLLPLSVCLSATASAGQTPAPPYPEEALRERAQDQDPSFDFAEALYQIAIVLASVAILADSRMIVFAAVAAGATATVLMLNGYFLVLPLPL